MKGVEEQIAALPAASRVTVTCSPVKGIPATIELVETILAAGHRVVPHFAGRLVRDAGHVRELATWCRSTGIEEIFVIAGDAPEQAGSYADAVTFLEAFLGEDHGVSHIGVTAYPEGHPLIAEPALRVALHRKQQLLAAAGLAGHASTQMCFSAATIERWLRAERAAGLTLPIRLGIPGAVERARLLRMSSRLGIGTSMRYLKKNRGAILRLLSPARYDTTALLDELGAVAAELQIDGLHIFTFNSVEPTVAWLDGLRAEARS